MAGRGDIEAGRAFVTLFLKNNLTRQLTGVIDQTRAGLKQFASIAKPIGMALFKIGTAISASYIALAAGNQLVVQKTQEVHRILANAIAPAVLPIIEHARKAALAFAQWASHNKGTLTLILQTGLKMVALGTALKLAALAARGLAAALLIAKVAVVAISTMLATTWLGPLLIGLGVVLAIGAAAYALSSSFRHFFSQNLGDVQIWAGNIRKSIDSFVNAIADGRFALAWRIALLAAEIEYSKFNSTITAGWSATVSSLARMLQIAWDVALAAMKVSWVVVQNTIAAGWVTMLTPLANLLDTMSPLLQQFGIDAAGFARSLRDTMAGGEFERNKALIAATVELANALAGTKKGGFFDALNETLKGMVADAKEGVELKAAMLELDALRKAADKREGFGAFGMPGQIKSAISAGGAAALGFGSAGDDLPKRQFSEIQEMRKTAAEHLRLAREMAARRERPGVFGR